MKISREQLIGLIVNKISSTRIVHAGGGGGGGSGYGMIGSYETKEISPERLAKFFVEEGIVSVDGFDTEDKVETNK